MSDYKISKPILNVKSMRELKTAIDALPETYTTIRDFVKKNGVDGALGLIIKVKSLLKLYDMDEQKFVYLINTICTAHYSVSVLDKEEYDYLSVVLRPFRKSVSGIIKECINDKYEYLLVTLVDGDNMSFPNFEKGTMYKGMVANSRYTLEALGL